MTYNATKLYMRLDDFTIHTENPGVTAIVLYETPVDRIVPVGKFAMYDLIVPKDTPYWIQDVKQIIGVHDGADLVVCSNTYGREAVSFLAMRLQDLEQFRLFYPGRMIFPPDAGMAT